MLAQLATTDQNSETSWQRFSVNYEYPVSFTENVFDAENLLLLNALTRLEQNKQHRVSVFVDAGVAIACPTLMDDIASYFNRHHEHMILAASPMIMTSGEEIKSDPHLLKTMQNAVAEQHIDRHSFVIGIGGGALLDAIGLVAATAHRGIRLIRIPTTVLAQNDSGVGVKNSVNLFGQKNYLGTFATPFAVINDYGFIEALPRRDKIAGIAEAVKVALIRDKQFFMWLENNVSALARFRANAMRYMIRRCAELHMHQIAHGGDPFESGSARPLDFGHWSAHRLEAMTNYRLRHGEAVAVGIALDARYSVLSGHLPSGDEERICQLLENLGFRLWQPELASQTGDNTLEVLSGLVEFKEHLGGELTITLLASLGNGIEVHTIDHEKVVQSVAWLQNRQHRSSACISPIRDIARKASEPTLADNTVAGKTGDSSPSTHPVNRLDSEAVISHLYQWLATRLNQQNLNWLDERLQLISDQPPDRDLHITLGLIPRKLGRDDLLPGSEEIKAAQLASGRQWNPTDWTIDTTARCLIICRLQQCQPGTFDEIFTDLCKTAELHESIAFYRCISILPPSKALDTVIGTGLRTHIGSVFEAIAHNNPYPYLYFDENRWNHMVLKALFVDSSLWPIYGLEERSNPTLATILCDYANERWAANRLVTPELWRCVGPFASGAMLDDLHRALEGPHFLGKQAALLALMSSPNANHTQLRADHPLWCALIDAGKLSWNTLSQQLDAGSID